MKKLSAALAVLALTLATSAAFADEDGASEGPAPASAEEPAPTVTQEKMRPRSDDAFVRVPAWRSASTLEAQPRATFPVLFQGRF